MNKVNNGLLDQSHGEVLHESNINFNAPHHYKIISVDEENKGAVLGEIHFQEGPIKKYGINGVTNEQLLAIVIDRLEHFQRSPYSSRDNAITITHVENALLRLKKRTIERESRGVEGTDKI